MNFPEKLAMLIARAGLKQNALAKKAQVDAQRITNWKDPTSKRQPTPEQYLNLARALGVPVEYLLDDRMDEPPPPVVTPDEQHVIDAMRALKLGREEALMRIHAGGMAPQSESLGSQREVTGIEVEGESASKRPLPKPKGDHKTSKR